MTRVKSDWTASSGISGSVAPFLIPFLRSDCPARPELPCHLNDSFANLTSVTDYVNHVAADCGRVRTLTPLSCARILPLYGRGAHQLGHKGTETGDGVESGAGGQFEAGLSNRRVRAVRSATE